ncbi:MAG: LysM peptidoglycan-binding domain-containing protein [Chloroflexota bacterium]
MNLQANRPRLFRIVLLTFLLACACNLPFFAGSDAQTAVPPGPIVNIQQPSPGAQVEKGDSFLISAIAMDEAGVIRIDLWVDGQMILSQASPDANGVTPFSLNYPLVAAEEGSYTLVARAYNSQGLMGESAAHAVNVTAAAAESAAAAQELGQYVVQQGDTLESIAGRAGVSVEEIIKLNPSISNGQVAPGQVILIPLPKAPPVAAAPPQAAAGGQPGQSGQSGSQAGNQNKPPGLQPAALPGALPGVQMGGQAWGGQIAPAGGGFPGMVVNPAIGAIVNPNNRLPAPDAVQVSVTGDCQVKVSWKDNAANETEYRVRRIPPGGGAETIAAVLKPNTQEYVDSVPEPGKYQYSVWVGVAQGNKVSDHNASQFVVIDVPSSPVCQPLPKWMRVFFQPVEFKPHNAAFSEGFINAGIGVKKGLPYMRLPQGQGESAPVAQFGSPAYQLEFWLPAAMGPGDALDFTLVGSARQPNNPPLPQGQFTALHKYEELTGPNRKQVYQSPQQGQAFDFSYKLYLEPWQWGAPQAQPSSLLPKPTNLKLAVAQNGDHKLTWDYDKAARDKYVSGFNVYRDYFCPGFDYKMELPVVLGRGAASANLAAAAMPTGCVCSYQVSAFGQGGESELSDGQTPSDCYTFTPDSSVTVTFKSLEISNQTLPQARNAYLYLWANYYPLETFNKAHFFAGTHDLSKIELNGQKGNPTVTVNMKKGQSLQLGFYLANTCKSVDVTIPAANLGAAQDVVVQSADGGCKLVVNVKGSAGQQQPGGGQAGGQPAGGAGPGAQQPKYGPNCGDTGCTIEFVNNTSYNIVGLNITRLGNKVTENPIGQPNQVICPGCSLPVHQFYDEQYQYQAYYGAWAQGQAQPAVAGSGPLSPVFAGTAQKISIQDPKAQSQDEQTLRKLLGTSSKWSLGAFSGDPNICLGYCKIHLEFDAHGAFKYSELDPNSLQYVLVATGQYQMIVHKSANQIFRVRLKSNSQAATFTTDAYFSYGTGCFIVTINSQRFGKTLVYASGNCPFSGNLDNLLPPCAPNDPAPECRP